MRKETKREYIKNQFLNMDWNEEKRIFKNIKMFEMMTNVITLSYKIYKLQLQLYGCDK